MVEFYKSWKKLFEETYITSEGHMDSDQIFDALSKKHSVKSFNDLNWEGSFKEYLDIVIEKPEVASTAFRRMYDMIASHGYEKYVDSKKEITHWKFF